MPSHYAESFPSQITPLKKFLPNSPFPKCYPVAGFRPGYIHGTGLILFPFFK